jgi:hypothetical protein
VARKKFKTIAGYLKSAGNDFYDKQERANRAGTLTVSEEQARRDILNYLLPQIGIKGQIGPAEKPIDVITRLRQAPERDAGQIENLDTCLQWLGRRLGPSSVFVGATTETHRAISGGVTRAVECIFRGVDYTIEQVDGFWRWRCDGGGSRGFVAERKGFASKEAAAADARQVINEHVSRAHNARAEIMTSYHVHGFRRDDHETRVCMIVDANQFMSGGDSPHTIAGKIAGPEYCFHACSNINQRVLVPDHLKNRLFTTADELKELYAAVPQLNPQPRRAARRRAL